tara:strand:+ start:412 stop:678 length:267 start_codon:yes stop_codon:yes gene_type:complete
MTITAAIVLFAIIWFMVLFICLPLKVKTQGDSGEVVPGTPESAPENGDIKNKILLVTAITGVLWVISFSIIVSEIIKIEDIDIFNNYN